jgi:hypothetical protein
MAAQRSVACATAAQVYHEHPGATAIVQRLGRVMLERFQQTEERLQKILSQQERQSQVGARNAPL